MKRRNVVLVALVLLTAMLLAALLAACGSSAQVVEVTRLASEVVAEGDMAGAAAPEMAAMEEAAMEAPAAEPAPQVGLGQERLIIRTAEMAIVAADTEEALTRIAEMANSSGGWVVSSNVYQSTETAKTGYIQIRVPSEGFQSVLDAISGLAVEVSSLSTSGQDVTEEYVDLSSQLTNLEATAARVRTFLDDATRVEDALAVNAELSRLEGEIAVIKGRMQYLDQSAAFSSITVNVTPDELTQPIEVAGWQPQGAAKRAVEALINALQTLADLMIWFAIFVLPVLALILLPFLLIIWLIRRLRRRERVVTPPATPPTE